MQNTAAKLLSGLTRHQCISSTVAASHWLPVCFCANLKMMTLTYKALKGLGPWYLTERLLPLISACPTPLSQAGQLRILTPRETQKEKTRNWAFLVVVVSYLWNQHDIHLALKNTWKQEERKFCNAGNSTTMGATSEKTLSSHLDPEPEAGLLSKLNMCECACMNSQHLWGKNIVILKQGFCLRIHLCITIPSSSLPCVQMHR